MEKTSEKKNKIIYNVYRVIALFVSFDLSNPELRVFRVKKKTKKNHSYEYNTTRRRHCYDVRVSIEFETGLLRLSQDVYLKIPPSPTAYSGYVIVLYYSIVAQSLR